MSVHELHPEELLERAARGVATEEELCRLHDHTSRCVACRFELQVRTDFDAEARPFESAAEVQRFVTLSLLQAGKPVELSALPSPSPPRRVGPRRAWLAVAATLLLVSGMAAAQWDQIAPMFGLSASRTDAHPQAPTRIHRPSPPVRSPAVLERERSTEGAATATEPTSRPAKTAHVPRQTSQHKAGSRSRERAVALRERREGMKTPPSETSAKRKVSNTQTVGAAADLADTEDEPREGGLHPRSDLQTEGAAELFERAATARRRGEYREAIALYDALRERFPGSQEARLSLVVAARLKLDRGQTQAALTEFEAYLVTGDGALREEAMAGRSQALERLGRTVQHRESVETLRLAYPNSAYVKALDKRRAP